MTEIWKDISGFEGLYQVSNLGRVKSLNYRRTKKEGYLSTPNDGIYNVVVIGKKTRYVHRLVAEAFIPNPDMKQDVNHINCNKSDNRAENLEWVSRSENQAKFYASEKWEKLKAAERKYYLALKGDSKREYDLIVGSGKAMHVESGEVVRVKTLLENGYTIRCDLNF